MSDQLTDQPGPGAWSGPPPAASAGGTGGPPWVVLLQVVAVVLLFAAAGLLGGWLWHHLWSAPRGTVTSGVWYTDESGLRDEFTGTALYVVVALLTGIVVGGLCALLLARAELATLAAVTVGSLLAGWVMWELGVHLGPTDPQQLAKTAADGTALPGNLFVSGRVPFAAFPGGALGALAAVFLLVQKPRSRTRLGHVDRG